MDKIDSTESGYIRTDLHTITLFERSHLDLSTSKFVDSLKNQATAEQGLRVSAIGETLSQEGIEIGGGQNTTLVLNIRIVGQDELMNTASAAPGVTLRARSIGALLTPPKRSLNQICYCSYERTRYFYWSLYIAIEFRLYHYLLTNCPLLFLPRCFAKSDIFFLFSFVRDIPRIVVVPGNRYLYFSISYFLGSGLSPLVDCCSWAQPDTESFPQFRGIYLCHHWHRGHYSIQSVFSTLFRAEIRQIRSAIQFGGLFCSAYCYRSTKYLFIASHYQKCVIKYYHLYFRISSD